jgi:hypothetical protein
MMQKTSIFHYKETGDVLYSIVVTESGLLASLKLVMKWGEQTGVGYMRISFNIPIVK